jgi:hypothetical protein
MTLAERKELAVLRCASDRLELELSVVKERSREKTLADMFPRAWPWLNLLSELGSQIAPGSSGIMNWISALAPLVNLFKKAV